MVKMEKSRRLVSKVMMALVVIVMSAGLTNCESVAEKFAGGHTTCDKKLRKVVVQDSEGEGRRTVTFLYDVEGKLSSVTDRSFSSYEWGAGKIVRKSDGNLRSYNLNNSQKIVEEIWNDRKYKCEYYDGRLSRIRSEGHHDQIFCWNDDKLIKCESARRGETSIISFCYGSTTCKGYCPLFCFAGELSLAHPELYGCVTNQLPYKHVEVQNKEDGSKNQTNCTYNYEFYSDRYVKRVTLSKEYVYCDGTTRSRSQSFTYVWE